MKKNFSLFLLAFLMPVFVLVTAQCSYDPSEGRTGEPAARSVTMEGKFAEDRVLVVLKESDIYKNYGIEDFPEIVDRCISVVDLTSNMVSLIHKQLEAEKTGDWKELQFHVDNAMLMNIETFKRILCFTL